MLQIQVNMKQCYKPIPIALLIKTTNSFGCDIFLMNEQSKINAKSYNDLKQGLETPSKDLMFCFDGTDEQEAEDHFGRLFIL